MKMKNKKNAYIHIGGDVIIDSGDIIGIFDLDKITVFKVNRNYLSNAEKNGKIISVIEDLPKSCLLCQEKHEIKEKIYLSPLLTSTLLKRSELETLE